VQAPAICRRWFRSLPCAEHSHAGMVSLSIELNIHANENRDDAKLLRDTAARNGLEDEATEASKRHCGRARPQTEQRSAAPGKLVGGATSSHEEGHLIWSTPAYGSITQRGGKPQTDDPRALLANSLWTFGDLSLTEGLQGIDENEISIAYRKMLTS